MTPTCMCTAVVMVRAGEIVCGRCDAPLVSSSTAAGTTYSTASPAQYPPGCTSRRHARDRIARVPGHERSGTSRATVWTVAAEAYRRHYARTTTSTRPAPVIATDDEAAVEAAINAANVRMTRPRAA